MGTVVSIDHLRQLKRDGRKFGSDTGAGGHDDGPGGLTPSEYREIINLFDLARDAGLALQMSLQPYGDGFLFRAYAAADPYYTLFEIQKIHSGRIFEYQGRVRHQLISNSLNFFPFMTAMRAEIVRLVDLFGPPPPRP